MAFLDPLMRSIQQLDIVDVANRSSWEEGPIHFSIDLLRLQFCLIIPWKSSSTYAIVTMYVFGVMDGAGANSRPCFSRETAVLNRSSWEEGPIHFSIDLLRLQFCLIIPWKSSSTYAIDGWMALAQTDLVGKKGPSTFQLIY